MSVFGENKRKVFDGVPTWFKVFGIVLHLDGVVCFVVLCDLRVVCVCVCAA